MVPYRYGSVGREHQTESDVRLPFFETTIKTSIYERVPALRPGLFYFGFPRGRAGLHPGCRVKCAGFQQFVPAGLFPPGCSRRAVLPAAGPELFRGLRYRSAPLNCSAVSYGRLVSRDCSVRYLRPSRLAVSLGSAFLLTMIEVVLYSTNGREKYQNPS